MKKETIYYLVGGAVAIGLGYMAYTKYKGGAALQASLPGGATDKNKGDTSSKLVTREEAAAREETLLSILIKPSSDPRDIPLTIGKYGQIFTSRTNLVEALNFMPDISEVVPISLLMDIVNKEGIKINSGAQIKMEQWISQGKGNETWDSIQQETATPKYYDPNAIVAVVNKTLTRTTTPIPVTTTYVAPTYVAPTTTVKTPTTTVASSDRREAMFGLGSIEQLVL